MLMSIYYVNMNLRLTAFRSAKDNLKTGNFVVTLDFLENFAFDVQEAVQDFHWNNNQAINQVINNFIEKKVKLSRSITFKTNKTHGKFAGKNVRSGVNGSGIKRRPSFSNFLLSSHQVFEQSKFRF